MPEIVTFPDALDPDLIEAARVELLVCERRTPEVAALGTVASLARSIEPELLRALRVRLGSRIFRTQISVSAESALWFSNFVESRGADAITLLPESLRVLRPRLANDLELLEEARAIIEDCHRSAPDVLQWEERIVYLALAGKTSLMEDEVMRGLRSISSGTRRPLVNWVSDMWLRLPPEASANPLIGKLHQVASGLMRRRTQGQQRRESSAEDLILDFSSFPMRELGVVLKGDRFVFGDSPAARLGIQVPDLDPVELDVLAPSELATTEPLVIPRGVLAEITASRGPLRIRTLAGQIHLLDPDAFRRRNVFIGYSQRDVAWMQTLLSRLPGPEEGPHVEVWEAGQIDGGDKWYPELEATMASAAVALLLVSPDFLASEFCRKEEVPFLLKRQAEDGMALIPVLLRPCVWRAHRWLAERQMYPRDGKSLTVDFRGDEVNREFEQIAELALGLIEHKEITPPKLAPVRDIRVDISRLVQYAPVELIGRETETKILSDAWDQVVRGEPKRPRVLTFVALGGEGKTSLVAKWAVDLAMHDWRGCDAVFAWSFYSQGTREQTAASSDLFLKEALIFFGNDGDKEFAASNAGAFEKGHRLARIVGRQRSLLIVDGLEPLQYASTSPTPGELKDQGIAALLKGLAATSRGLCVVTTRYSLPDLKAFWQTTAPEVKLLRLSRDAGVHLLKTLGVKGSERRTLRLKDGEKVNEFEKLVEDVQGHALTLNLFGSYLRDAHAGDIRKRDLVRLEEADSREVGGRSFHMYAAYTRWLESEGDEGKRAVAMLRLMGFFDRPADAACVDALLKPPAISGLTEPLISLSDAQRNLVLSRLEATKLLTINRDATGALVSLDAHPLLREYSARQLREQTPDAWRAGHGRLYEHLTTTTTDKSEPTLEDLQPLAQAIASGCQAGLYQQTFDEVYLGRLQRNEAYVWRKLGAFGTDLGAIACFFDRPWSRVSPSLSEQVQAFVLHNAAFDLRALGRVTDAVEPMRAAVEMRIRQQDWKNAATSAGNMSELEMTLGEVAGALRDAEQSVTYADRSGDAFQRMSQRTVHADALHQAGRRAEARALFREAEQMQTKLQPTYPLLPSLHGFRYCELLMWKAERAAWQEIQRLEGSDPKSELLEACQFAFGRAAQTREWLQQSREASLLDVALYQVIGSRAGLYAVILRQSAAFAPLQPNDSLDDRGGGDLEEALQSARSGVDGLRRAGMQDHVPHGLLTRAWLRFLTNARTGPESAQEDLDEAWEIAERGLMKLFMADIHLYRARLFGMKDEDGRMRYPWRTDADGTARGPKDDLAAARKLIEQCGYWRRQEELEDAEEAAKNW